MIIYNNQNVKNFSKKNIKKYEETENFIINGCPKCGNKEIIKWGAYERNVIYYKNGEKIEKTIKIKRIRCKKCGKTHAIIPSFLAPYKIYVQEYITDVLKAEITRKESRTKISTKKKVSRQLIESWLKCFHDHYSRMMTMLIEKNKNRIIRKINKEIYEFIEKYYQENKLIYMMYIPKGNNRPILKWAPT